MVLSSTVAVHKCCPFGHAYLGSICRPSDLQDPNPPIYQAPGTLARGVAVHLLHSVCNNSFLLDPSSKEDEHYILTNGLIAWNDELHSSKEFCVENLSGQGLRTFICTDPIVDSVQPPEFVLYPVGLCLSLPFLLATLLTYIFIRDLWSAHGYYLASHIFCLLYGSVILIIVQTTSAYFSDLSCIISGMFTQAHAVIIKYYNSRYCRYRIRLVLGW
ncbi:G-protein coupled receptor Mth-like [Halyomorpha halys]|uniref:G-protein coupled receptor Mth-like n=1 Tax=Halyomorpha halys TaxID=286706 RepID=UPI0034D230AF